MTDYNNQALCIIGPGKSGKDTAAEEFSKHTWFKYIRPTSQYITSKARLFIRSEIGIEFKSDEDCWLQRSHYRAFWDHAATEINCQHPEGVGLYEMAFNDGQNIITGVRKQWELDNLIKYKPGTIVILIDRNGLEEEDRTYNISRDSADFIIPNPSVDALLHKIKRISGYLHFKKNVPH